MSATHRKILLWSFLLILSLLIHLGLTGAFSLNLGKISPPETGTGEQERQVVLETFSRPPPEPMQFEEPLTFTEPQALLDSQPLTLPPPLVDLTRQAAAGGASRLSPAPLADRVGENQSSAGPAGFGTAKGVGLSNSTRQFAAYVQGLREAGLDVVFALDATGSMGWVIKEVNARIIDIADTLRSLVPVTRFGVVVYRDHDDAEFVTRIQPLTFSLEKINRFLSGIEARGGGSVQEAVTAALTVAVDDAGWRTGSYKVVIIIGDAPPHRENFGELLELARDFTRQGGQVSTLDVSLESNPALVEASLGRTVNRALYRNRPMLDYQAIADAGNGVAATLDGDVQVARQLVNLIFGGQLPAEMAFLFGSL